QSEAAAWSLQSPPTRMGRRQTGRRRPTARNRLASEDRTMSDAERAPDDAPPGPGAREREIAAALADAHAYLEALPPQERRVADLAAAAMPVWEIAQQEGIADEAVARIIDRVYAAVTGRPIHPV